MKAGDPDAVLSVGGLDYHAGVVDGYKYIEDLYTAGAGDCFDAVALHPVSSTGRGVTLGNVCGRARIHRGRGNATQYNSGAPGQEINWPALTDTYAVLKAHGDGHKGMWGKSSGVVDNVTAFAPNFTRVGPTFVSVNEYGWKSSNEQMKVL